MDFSITYFIYLLSKFTRKLIFINTKQELNVLTSRIEENYSSIGWRDSLKCDFEKYVVKKIRNVTRNNFFPQEMCS